MYSEINMEILEAKEKLRRKEKLEIMVKQAEINLEEEMERQNELRNILEKEELDVKKLEGLSIQAVFSTIFGNKVEKLDKEKREFLSAKLKYDECCNTIGFVKSELEGYKAQLSELSSARVLYEDLMKKKQEAMLQSKDGYATQLMEVFEEMADLRATLKELKEAINVGRVVQSSLEMAQRSLDKAEDWGTWDMFGGGFISTSAKHSNIDDAVAYIGEARAHVSKFQRELMDVNMSVSIDVDISSFDKFADYFFDGLFADWNVQSKINSSQGSVNSALSRISQINYSLEANIREVERKLDGLEQKANSIIEGATD